MKFDSFMCNTDIARLLLRISVGGLLLFHGISKLIHGIDFVKNVLTGHHLPGFFAYGVYIGEIIAPVLLIIGLWTRLSALVISFNMLVTFIALGCSAFAINQFGGLTGELNLLFLFGALSLFFLGSGKYSVSKGNGRWD